MIVLGIVLLIIGYWFVPAFVPTVPPVLDHLCVGLGWLFLIVGLIFLFLSFAGHHVGGRRYWY
jgi:hypothetical protein